MSATTIDIAPAWKYDYDPAKCGTAVYDRLTRTACWMALDFKKTSYSYERGSETMAEQTRFCDGFAADPFPFVGNERSYEVIPFTAEALEAWAKAQDRIPYSAKRPRRRRSA